MSKFKAVSDIVVGAQELNRLIRSLDEDGFRKLFLKNSIQFGIFDNSTDGDFDNALVGQGTNPGTIRHNEILGIDSDGGIIYKAATDNIPVVNDNQWHWLKVAHILSPVESYLVSVDKSGNLSAPGGKLTEILRGLPNNPSRISFPNASLNIREYDVVEIINDENAVLAGDFLAETELQLAVVGSFTPGISIPSGSKYPFQYDSCTLTSVLEVVSNTPPALVAGKEFLIARIKRNGATITIQDKRRVNVYGSKSDFRLNEVGEATNALIGVESVRYDSNNTPREKNLVQLAWSFRSSNWTIDSSANRVTLIAGNGGKFKSTSDFTDGDFDGWRLYTEDGSYQTIRQSSLSATQINLILDTLDVDKFSNTTQQIIVAPNAEEIELIFTGDSVAVGGINLGDERVLLPINQPFAIIPLTVFEAPASYNVKYSYKNFRSYTKETAIPSDPVGYFVESAFNANGVQTGTTKQAYVSSDTDGFITLQLASNAYPNRINSIETGDLFGVQYKELNNSAPIYSILVGLNNQTQIFRTVALPDGLGSPYNFSVDHYIDLRTDVADIKNGNSFILKFTGSYIRGGFNLFITQNYINSGSTGVIKYEFKKEDFDYSKQNELYFECKFDGVNWIVKRFANLADLSIEYSGDLNDLTGSGFYFSAGGVNTPVGINGHVICLNYDTNRIVQTFIQDISDRYFFRRKYLGAWQPWVELATSAGSVLPTRQIATSGGLQGGGDLSTDRSLSIAANGVDSSMINPTVAGAGLAGGAGTPLAVNVDNSTIEINSDTLRLKDGGITPSKILDGSVVKSPDGIQLLTHVVNIGVWNMDSANTKSFLHGLSLASPNKIKFVHVEIFGDSGGFWNLSRMNPAWNGSIEGAVISWGSTSVLLARTIGGDFDNANFDDGAMNRGVATILYEA